MLGRACVHFAVETPPLINVLQEAFLNHSSSPRAGNARFSEDLGQLVTSRPSTRWSALLWAQSKPPQPPSPTCGRKQEQAQVVPKSTAANVALLHGSVLQTDSSCGVGFETRVGAL